MAKKYLSFIFLFLLCINTSVLAEEEIFTGETKIAFVSNIKGNEDIFIINDNGTGLTQLTFKKEDDIILYYSS